MEKNIITLELTVPTAMAFAVENLYLVVEMDKNFVVVVKNGTLYKSALL